MAIEDIFNLLRYGYEKIRKMIFVIRAFYFSPTEIVETLNLQYFGQAKILLIFNSNTLVSDSGQSVCLKDDKINFIRKIRLDI